MPAKSRSHPDSYGNTANLGNVFHSSLASTNAFAETGTRLTIEIKR